MEEFIPPERLTEAEVGEKDEEQGAVVTEVAGKGSQGET